MMGVYFFVSFGFEDMTFMALTWVCQQNNDKPKIKFCTDLEPNPSYQLD